MRLHSAIPAVLMLVSVGDAQTPISAFPYFYDWSNPLNFAVQPDGRTYLGGGDGHWGTYVAGGLLQFDVSVVSGTLTSEAKSTPDTLFTQLDVTGLTFIGNEVFTFSASRSGAPDASGTLYVVANSTVIKTVDVASELSTTMGPVSAPLPMEFGNSVFTVSIVAVTNKPISIDSTAFSGGALPVTLVSFTLSPSGGSVVLSWKTLTETDNYGFYVQKSDDRQKWVEIPGSFQPGHGTTVVPHSFTFADVTEPFGKYYRLRQVDLDGTNHYSDAVAYSGLAGNGSAAGGFALEQCYPNPFNPRTTITYRLSTEGHTTLTVYNAIGEEVATLVNEVVPAGEHSVVWDPSGKASGTYFCVLKGEGKAEKRKMLFVK